MSLTLLTPALDQRESHSGCSRTGFINLAGTPDAIVVEYYRDATGAPDATQEKVRIAGSAFLESVFSSAEFGTALAAAYDTVEAAGLTDEDAILAAFKDAIVPAAAPPAPQV